jgi:hypothetical protein
MCAEWDSRSAVQCAMMAVTRRRLPTRILGGAPFRDTEPDDFSVTSAATLSVLSGRPASSSLRSSSAHERRPCLSAWRAGAHALTAVVGRGSIVTFVRDGTRGPSRPRRAGDNGRERWDGMGFPNSCTEQKGKA